MFIELSNIVKKFKNHIVLNGLSYKFKDSHIYGVVGPNGIGKTTLFQCIVGLMELDNGIINVNGEHISIMKRESIVNNVSYLLSNDVINQLSGWDNAKLFADLYGIPDEKVEELFKDFDLAKAKSKKVKKYSLGMKQRLSLIISLINEKRKIIILDEPYLGLDPIGIRCLNEKLIKLRNRGYLIIVSNHQLHESEQIFDEVIFLTADGIISKNIKEESQNLFSLFNDMYAKREGE